MPTHQTLPVPSSPLTTSPYGALLLLSLASSGLERLSLFTHRRDAITGLCRALASGGCPGLKVRQQRSRNPFQFTSHYASLFTHRRDAIGFRWSPNLMVTPSLAPGGKACRGPGGVGPEGSCHMPEY